jgi:Domain of unknown function (DUF4249)
MIKNSTTIILFAIILVACKKPYNPVESSVNYNYLVVEGVINSSADSTFIKLSRTVTLSSKTTLNPELHAVVTVEGDQGNSYPLTETTNGSYVSPGLNLDNAHKYRLRIKTFNGEQYLSDFAAVLNAPQIDSVNYLTDNKGANIFVSTHDPKNATRYYRWGYNETWRYNSAFVSYYKSNGDTVLTRDILNDQIYSCWRTSDTSSTIVLSNSTKLTNDVIANQPLTSVGGTDERLGKEFCIQVLQYALTPDAYSFWQNVQKNTQQLGSIFDAQPSQLNGNIHCISNPSLTVIGYVSVGAVASTRFFIFNRNLPAYGVIQYPEYDTCGDASLLYKYYPKNSVLPINQVDMYINWNKAGIPESDAMIPIEAIQPTNAPEPIGYVAGVPICVDCTLRGTRIQPPYWRYQ